MSKQQSKKQDRKKDLTADEQRIVTNLRKMAAKTGDGTIEAKLSIHDKQLKYEIMQKRMIL